MNNKIGSLINRVTKTTKQSISRSLYVEIDHLLHVDDIVIHILFDEYNDKCNSKYIGLLIHDWLDKRCTIGETCCTVIL